jgi:hypothetical protein
LLETRSGVVEPNKIFLNMSLIMAIRDTPSNIGYRHDEPRLPLPNPLALSRAQVQAIIDVERLPIRLRHQ